jgi:hypothetical protein
MVFSLLQGGTAICAVPTAVPFRAVCHGDAGFSGITCHIVQEVRSPSGPAEVDVVQYEASELLNGTTLFASTACQIQLQHCCSKGYAHPWGGALHHRIGRHVRTGWRGCPQVVEYNPLLSSAGRQFRRRLATLQDLDTLVASMPKQPRGQDVRASCWYIRSAMKCDALL